MESTQVFVDILGRKLYGWLAGEGSPLVILDAGLGDTSQGWLKVQSEVARFTRVLSYDRAGMGRSDKAPTPRTCLGIVADLRALLSAANLPPPYILVAHSWSGLNARYFANQYTHEVAGMVLVDAIHEDKYDRFAQVLTDNKAQLMWASINDPTKNDECIDRMTSIAEVTGSHRSYDFPLIVLTRIADSDPLNKIEVDLQAEFLQLSSNSKQLFSKNTSHYIHNSEPELVIDAVHQVVNLVRKDE